MSNAGHHIPSASGVPRHPKPEITGPEITGPEKADFLAGMTHAIRTPLNAILGFSELGERAARDATLRSYFSTIREAGTRLHTLLSDVLDLSRTRDGEYIPFTDWLPWPSWLLGATEDAFVEAALWDIQMVLDTADDVCELESDPAILRRVLMRLMTNAISYTPAGGSISVATRVEPGADPSSAWLSVRVQDTGTGIPEALQDHLFDGFVQGENAAARGPGIGLALSKALLGTIGGSLDLASSSDSGSTFVMRVPVGFRNASGEGARPLTEDPASSAPAPPNLQGIHVVVADDEPTNRALMVALLAETGAEILEAANGQEAVHLARSGQTDIFLLDIRMPIMDGLTAAQRLRADGIAAPLIALTGHDHPPGERTDVFDAWLNKPIDSESLYAAIKRVLGDHTASSHPADSTSDQANLASAKASGPHLRENRQVLLRELRAMQDEVQALRRNQSITLIEALGLRIARLAREADHMRVQAWGEKLAHHASLFEMVPMNHLLSGFEDLLRELED